MWLWIRYKVLCKHIKYTFVGIEDITIIITWELTLYNLQFLEKIFTIVHFIYQPLLDADYHNDDSDDDDDDDDNCYW